MSTTIITEPTIKGWRLFAESGFVNNLYGVDFKDDGNNYTVTATNNIIPLVNGVSTTTTAFCSKSNDSGLYNTPLTTEEVSQLTNILKLTFNAVDCADEFSLSSPSFTINLYALETELRNLTYSYSMPGLTKVIYDVIQGVVQYRDPVTNTYVDKNPISNFEKIVYRFKDEFSYMNYNKVSPLYVQSTNGSVGLVDNTSNTRWSSPLLLTFTTASVGGSFVDGTSAILSVRPDEWGYWCKNSVGFTFKTITEVETNPGSYTEIYPAIRIGNQYFYKNSSTPYPTDNGYVGELYNMVNTDGSGQRATTALADAISLFAKSNFKLDSTGVYSSDIKIKTGIVDPRVNGYKIVGNNLTFTFKYDTTYTGNIITH